MCKNIYVSIFLWDDVPIVETSNLQISGCNFSNCIYWQVGIWFLPLQLAFMKKFSFLIYSAHCQTSCLKCMCIVLIQHMAKITTYMHRRKKRTLESFFFQRFLTFTELYTSRKWYIGPSLHDKFWKKIWFSTFYPPEKIAGGKMSRSKEEEFFRSTHLGWRDLIKLLAGLFSLLAGP